MQAPLSIYPDGGNVFVVAQPSDTGVGRHLRWVEATQGPMPIVNAAPQPTPLVPAPVPANSFQNSFSSSTDSFGSTLSSIPSSSSSSSLMSSRYSPGLERDTGSASSSQSSRGPSSMTRSRPSTLRSSGAPLEQRGDETDLLAAKDFIHGNIMKDEDVKPPLPINPLLSGTLSSITSMPSTSSFSSAGPHQSPVTPRRGLRREGAIAFNRDGVFPGSSTDTSTSSGSSGVGSWGSHSAQASTSQFSCHQLDEPVPVPVDNLMGARTSSSQGNPPRTPRRRTQTAHGALPHRTPGASSHPSSSSPTSPGPIRHRARWQRSTSNNNKTTPGRLQRMPTSSPPPSESPAAADRAWSEATELADDTEQYRTGNIPACNTAYPPDWIACSSNRLTTHPTEPALDV